MNGNSNLIDRPDLIKDSSGRTTTNRSMVSLHEYADITDTARYNVSIPLYNIELGYNELSVKANIPFIYRCFCFFFLFKTYDRLKVLVTVKYFNFSGVTI